MILPLPADEVAARVEAGTLTDLAGIGAEHREGDQRRRARRAAGAAGQAGGGTFGPLVQGGEELRGRLRGDLHSHSDWSDGGSPIEEMAFTAIELGHEYLVLTDHSPRLTVANGLSVERLTRQLGVVDAINDHLAGQGFTLLKGIEVDILDDGSLDQTDELLARLDVRVASVHSKLRMDGAADDAADDRRDPQPADQRARPLHRPDGDGQPRHPAAVDLRREGRLQGLRRARRGRRDQLPTRASRPADPAARAGPRPRLPVLDRQRRPRARPARLPPVRLRTRDAAGIEPDRIVNTWPRDRLLAWANP